MYTEQNSPLKIRVNAELSAQLLSPLQLLSPAQWRNQDALATVQALEHQKRTPVATKGRCWACWESDDTAGNPLIRACAGCRDNDLQWIHQDCADRFLNSLPPSDAQGPASPEALGKRFSGSRSCAQTRCSRCGDAYNLSYVEVAPLRVMWETPALRRTIVGMNALLWTATGLFALQNAPGLVPLALLAACHGANAVALGQMMRYSSGRYVRRMHPVGQTSC